MIEIRAGSIQEKLLGRCFKGCVMEGNSLTPLYLSEELEDERTRSPLFLNTSRIGCSQLMMRFIEITASGPFPVSG